MEEKQTHLNHLYYNPSTNKTVIVPLQGVKTCPKEHVLLSLNNLKLVRIVCNKI